MFKEPFIKTSSTFISADSYSIPFTQNPSI
jgi:hypothetical protein